MKIKKSKGKVHPTPSSTTPPVAVPTSTTPIKDANTALNLLPATILALTTILTFQDREVLAYMITRSIKVNPVFLDEKTNKKRNNYSSNNNNSKKQREAGLGLVVTDQHKPPVFECGCFDCYTCYWYRWDSSPNREIIHKAIEAFEDHLGRGEKESEKSCGRGKRRERIGRRGTIKDKKAENEIVVVDKAEASASNTNTNRAANAVLELEPPILEAEKVEYVEPKVVQEEIKALTEVVAVTEVVAATAVEPIVVVQPILEPEEEAKKTESPKHVNVVPTSDGRNHKVFARKVLPDLIGIFNWRFWKQLWNPNA